jgi:addiction module HigA family antidote
MTNDNAYIASLRRMARRPSSPGDLLADLMESNGLTQGELAERLGVGRQTINHLINGRRSLTPDLARRLGRFFGSGPALWLRMQQQLDLWDALHADEDEYKSIKPLQRAA